MFCLVIPFSCDVERLEDTITLIAENAVKYKITEVMLCHNGGNFVRAEIEEIFDKEIGLFKLLHTEKKGLGEGYKLGIINASSEKIILSASDLPFGFTDIESFNNLTVLEREKYRVCIGSKAHENSVMEGYSLLRRLYSKIFYLLRRLLLGKKSPKDSQGTIIIDKILAKELVESVCSGGYFFSVEMIMLAIKRGANVIELPVVFRDLKLKSNVMVINLGLSFMHELLKLRRRM